MVATADLSGPARDELLVTYPAVILHGDKADIAADSLNSLITSVKGYWPVLIARMLPGGTSAGIGPLKSASAGVFPLQ